MPRCGCSRRTVFKNLDALQGQGLLTVETRVGRSSVYRLSWPALHARTRAKSAPPTCARSAQVVESIRIRDNNAATTSARNAATRAANTRQSARSAPTPVQTAHPEPEVEPIYQTGLNGTASLKSPKGGRAKGKTASREDAAAERTARIEVERLRQVKAAREFVAIREGKAEAKKVLP